MFYRSSNFFFQGMFSYQNKVGFLVKVPEEFNLSGGQRVVNGSDDTEYYFIESDTNGLSRLFSPKVRPGSQRGSDYLISSKDKSRNRLRGIYPLDYSPFFFLLGSLISAFSHPKILARTPIQIMAALERQEQFDKKKRTLQLSGQRYRTIWSCLQFGATLFDMHDVDMTALASTTFLQAAGTPFLRI